MTETRAQAYGRVMRTLGELALHPGEEHVVREAADDLLFCRDFSADTRANDALAAVYQLTDGLVASERLGPERAQRLAADLEACGPFESGERAAA